MADPVDGLFQDWRGLGGAVLVAGRAPYHPGRPPEVVIAESTAQCRASSRLTWVVLDWLLRHVEKVDVQTLLQRTRERGDLSVLGVLADAANQRRPHPTFERIVRTCAPNPTLEVFFHRVAQSPLAARLAREHALDLFRRWNYLSSELCYLGDEPGYTADHGPSSTATLVLDGSSST